MAIPAEYFRTDGTSAQGAAAALPAAVAPAFVKSIISDTGLGSLVNISTTPVPEIKFTLYGGTPQFRRQASQGADKAVTNQSVSSVTAIADTYAAIGIFSRQGIKGVLKDPRQVLNERLRQEMVVQLEAEMLGIYRKDAAWASGFTTPLDSLDAAHTTTWASASGLLGFADSLSVASEAINDRNYIPNGALVGRSLQARIQRTRATTTNKDALGATTSTQESPNNLYNGLNDLNPDLDKGVLPTINLKDPMTAAVGDVIAVVGDYLMYAIALYEQLTTRVSTEATVVNGAGDEIRLWQTNSVGLLTEFEAAGGCVDVDAFQLVKKA